MTTKLEAQAAALRAINIAKHRAAGKTHRIQINIYGSRGAYRETKVFYAAPSDPNAYARRRLEENRSSRLDDYQVESIGHFSLKR